MRVGFSTSSYLVVDELSLARASRPARTRGAWALAPVDVMNENPLSQPTLSLSTLKRQFLPQGRDQNSSKGNNSVVSREIETSPVALQ